MLASFSPVPCKRVVVIGGGPAGLLAARLLALSGFAVKVFERLEPSATYGFGVALAGRALDRLYEQDREAADRIAALCYPLKRWTMHRGDQSASVEDRGAFGVARAGLLRTLQTLAAEAGAHIEAGAEAQLRGVADEGDVVVLADGVGSRGREALAPRLGVKIDPVAIPYIWCGAKLELDSMTLDIRRSEHGIFCAHVMPYGGGGCTFQVDTITETLRAARLGEDGGSGSDETSLGMLSRIFSPLLQGETLLGNRSRWNTFRLVRCERWSCGRFVLLGDAAHTAHYTVGSGTRMAMEDAIVLSQALSGEASLAAAFESYEKERRPAVEHLQWRATRSQTWWRTLSHRYDLPLPVLLFSYFTRTGSVGLEKLMRSNPEIAGAAVEHRRQGLAPIGPGASAGEALAGTRALPKQCAEVLTGRILSRGDLRGEIVEIDCDEVPPWSQETLVLARELRARELSQATERQVLLTGGAQRRRTLDRFDIAEEMAAATRAPVAVVVPADALDDAATAVAAGRTDYVVLGG